MIFVCEPQCKGLSHEKVNSGFLTALRVAYPGRRIRLYADASHHEGLLRLLAHDGVSVDGLEHRPFLVRDPMRLGGAWSYFRQFQAMLRDAAEAGVREVLFLSASPIIHHLIKRLKATAEFARFRFAFVLHASFEEIADDRAAEPAQPAIPEPSLVDKLRSIRPDELPAKLAGFVRGKLAARYTRAWQARFREKEQLLWRHSPDFRYLALAPHVVSNAAKYLDVAALNVHAIDMPINFVAPRPAPVNEHLKLATFGFGDIVAMQRLAAILAERKITRPYELRIIGMDNRGLDAYPNIHCPSPGRPLPRAEMERYAEDIDVFLILYDQRRYRLSCSGSIFEALSYVKPVVHLGNASVAQFESEAAPIGYPCQDLEAVADRLADMIEHHERYRPELERRRQNILALRERLSMERLAPRLRAALALGEPDPRPAR